MEKEFVPYELAVKLKELGFKTNNSFGSWAKVVGDDGIKYVIGADRYDRLIAPLWQQAFDWFREKNNAVVSFNWHTKGKLVGEEFILEEERTTRKDLINWAYEIDYFGANFERELTDESDAGDWGFEKYEQCRIACLEKLIELVANTETK